MSEMEIAQRIRMLMSYSPRHQRPISGSELAKVLGVSPARVSQLRQKGGLTAQQVISLCDHSGVNYRWLLTGKGDIFLQEDAELSLSFSAVAHRISLIPEPTRTVLVQLVNTLVEQALDTTVSRSLPIERRERVRQDFEPEISLRDPG